MKALFKWLGGAVVVLLVLGVAAALILPMVINPNDYKGEITQVVRDQTGMTLEIKGNIDWSVFPWVGLSLQDLVIDDPQQKPLGTLKHVSVKVKLMPLLSKQLDISTVELDGLTLNMVVDKNGQPNWLPQPKTAGTSAPVPPNVPEDGHGNGSTPLLANLNVAGIAITDISVNYQNIPARQEIAITNAQLQTGAITFGKPFTLTSSFMVNNRQPAMKAEISLNGTVTPDPEQASYTIDNLKLSVTPAVKSDAETLVVDGRIAAKGSDVNGKVSVAPLDLAAFMQQMNLPLPKLAGGDKVLRKVSLGTAFKMDKNSVTMNDLFAIVDSNELKGTFAVTDLKTQAITFNLKGNNVVVDPYMPVAETAAQASGSTTAPSTVPASAKAPSSSKTSTADDVIIPVDVIQTLNVHGKAELASLTVKDFRFDNPNLEIKASSGYAQLTSLNAGFYQGMIEAAAAVDVRGRLEKAPQISAKADVKSISIPALAKQLSDLEKVTGQANANLKILSHGLTQNQLTRGLNGTVDFNIADGALLGTNFNQMVCGVIAKVRKERSTKTDWPNQTSFQKLQGTVRITEGVAHNNDLTAALAQLNLKGDGSVDLVNQMMDYHVGLTITGDTADDEDSACRINEKYANITWPVLCKGKLGDSGLCGIDEQRLGQVLGKIAEQEIKGKLQKKLEDKLKDSLKGLFN
ncbi:AsmA family protein [Sansalvadorimonas verongulae]|uniref:AsmA family protein n=1 Tax=Sansalvadorimonas verongulae TaxID=2172824 RepID=UPI0012BC84B0|nr:AsmA family protein [Sansalvadorimonas verongulae]MTI13522.1 AsmA family protein [Sansalvadorimonas verongulae]